MRKKTSAADPKNFFQKPLQAWGIDPNERQNTTVQLNINFAGKINGQSGKNNKKKKPKNCQL